MSQAKFQCRMYENRYPEVEDLVMVNVRQIAEMGAYVNLLEYNNIEGMILLSELSRRRIRSIQKLIRVGRNEVVVVLRVDKEKGYIDLSKRRVSAEDIQKCEEKFNKSKAVHSIMRHVVEKLDISLEELYVNLGWPLYRKFGHAYDAFKLVIAEGDRILEGLNIPEEQRRELMLNIRRRLTPQPIKIRSDIEVTCFSYEGIDAIRQSLKKGEMVQAQDTPIKIRLVAPPYYVMIMQTLDKQLGIETMEKAINLIAETVRESKGELVIKMKPRAVSETDEKELAALMERVERENAEVSGDNDDEEEVSDEDVPHTNIHSGRTRTNTGGMINSHGHSTPSKMSDMDKNTRNRQDVEEDEDNDNDNDENDEYNVQSRKVNSRSSVSGTASRHGPSRLSRVESVSHEDEKDEEEEEEEEDEPRRNVGT